MSSVKDPDNDPNLDTSTTLFHRRIEFHLARKPFTGFGDGGNGGGFRLEKLNAGNSNPFLKSEPHMAWSGSGPGSVKALGSSLENNSGLDSELSFRITFNKIGAGLQNLGNTCFLNSVLQCLTYTEPLAAYLKSGRHKNSCRTAGFCALCAIQNHVSRALESTGRILAPKDLVSNLRSISRNFRNARQEDAHEYMVNLLESMHKCCLPAGVPSESPSAYEKSLVHKIFGGRLRSQVMCMQCSYCSNKFDPFLDLSLEILKADSIEKALAHFAAKDLLDGGERQYQCQQCKQKVRALKQLTVYKAPEVLAIHLKRFSAHLPGKKIDKHVNFGTTLDLTSFVSGPHDGDLKYSLYGVLVHAGWSTHVGHYYCFVRTSSGNWYSLDDNQVIQVSEKRVLEQRAYMLFYFRNRKYSFSKKNVDVAQQESMILNVLGNKVYNNLNHGLKETLTKESVGKKSSEPSATESQNPAVKSHCLTKSQATSSQNQKDNGHSAADFSSLKKDLSTGTALKLLPKIDSVNGPPVSNFNTEKTSMQTASSVKEKINESVTVLNSANMECNAQKDAAAPLSAVHVDNDPKNAAGKTEGDTAVIPTMCSGEARSGKAVNNSGDNLSHNNFLHRSSEETPILLDNNNTGKVGGLLLGNDFVSDSPGLNVCDIREGKSEPVGQSSVCRKPSKTKCLEVKKRHFKHQITRMHLSSNIIFGAALGWQKKRHKRSRQLSLRKLDGNAVLLSDSKPSMADKSKTWSNLCFLNSTKRTKHGVDQEWAGTNPKNLTGNGYLLRAVIDLEFNNRLNQGGAALLTDTESQNVPCIPSADNLSSLGSVGSKFNIKDHMENGLLSIHTRGLDETTVAPWDGKEHPSSEILSYQSDEKFSIGYVADEWDEEYDRGKRKKIRNSKIEFGGHNPFQEAATKKAKLKKHSSSANQPFRI